MQQQWSAVDNYLVETLIPNDPLLSLVLENNQRAGLPAIDVAANQGQFLALLVRMTGARRILEIGTLGGYSTIWMARELPADGELLTLEADAHHAAVARENLRKKETGGKIEPSASAEQAPLAASAAASVAATIMLGSAFGIVHGLAWQYGLVIAGAFVVSAAGTGPLAMTQELVHPAFRPFSATCAVVRPALTCVVVKPATCAVVSARTSAVSSAATWFVPKA